DPLSSCLPSDVSSSDDEISRWTPPTKLRTYRRSIYTKKKSLSPTSTSTNSNTNTNTSTTTTTTTPLPSPSSSSLVTAPSLTVSLPPTNVPSKYEKKKERKRKKDDLTSS
ncbi:hypothetical protein HMI55_005743, partial [Coelomomyces lativittatus]